MDLATVLVSSYQMYLISRSRLESYNSFNRHAMEITSRPKLKGKQFPLVGVGIFISPGGGNIHFSPGVEIFISSQVWKYSFLPGCGNIHFSPSLFYCKPVRLIPPLCSRPFKRTQRSDSFPSLF